ncbi:MAG: hypothetical protein ABIW50_04035 [Candidatus Limnocylindria bacterium]
MVRTATDGNRERWTPMTALVAVAMIAFLLVQLAMPALALSEPRPARFGWQMYTAVPTLPTVRIEAADGSLGPVDLGGLVARGRADADFSSALAAHLCATTNAAAVVLDSAGTTQRVACP